MPMSAAVSAARHANTIKAAHVSDWQRVHQHRHVHHHHAFQQEWETKEPVSKPRRKELFALVYSIR
jgi:hypothetical protein